MRRNENSAPVTRWFRGFAGLALGVVLMGCEPPAFLTPKATVYDGAWVGRFQMTYGLQDCKLRRGGIRVKVDGGEVAGKVRLAGVNAPFYGYIDEAAELRDGTVKAEFAKDSAEVSGSFNEKEAEGTWKSKNCRGSWELRKVR